MTRRSVEETAASILKIIDIKKINENYLSSKSGVRKQILDKYKIDNEVMISNVDEDEVKISLLAEGADPSIVSKTLQKLNLSS